MEKKVSIIIPAFNVEKYIGECIESIKEQSYNNYEVIIINDGSTDNTLSKIKEYEKMYKWMSIIDIENHGQGHARNIALKQANGEYVMFLDADDFIEKVTLETAVKRIEEDKSDLVVFDWKYYNEKLKNYSYVNKDTFFSKKELNGDECLDLLKIKHYFTVNKLYRKSFLLENNITYAEGYIYEDNPFWVKIAVKAKKVSLIHSPLYNVRANENSTTKTNYNTDKHCDSFIKAAQECLNVIKEKNNYTSEIYLYKYLIKKFNVYYKKRTPKKYKKEFLHNFINILSSSIKERKNDDKKERLVHGLNDQLFYYKKIKTISIILILYRIKVFISNNKKKIIRYKNKLKTYFCRRAKKEDIILFMGFDYRYTGNSRYLFESLVKKSTKKLYFITNNKEVSDEYRIIPKSKQMYKIFNKAKIVIFESWIPREFKKQEDTIWIQLWHGTPLKKMLFDSEESEIITVNPRHKIQKFNDIKNWDYLLLDSPNISKYFETSFLFSNEKFLNFGYPRVKYLLDNKNDIKLKEEIKLRNNIDKNKKVLLYLPTWRDYNYGKSEQDFDFEYSLDYDRIKEKLGEQYVIISKNHTFLNKKNSDTITNSDTETQELLLIADYLITDYSSVLFDALAIDLPIILLANDFEKYSKSRGVYQEIWTDLESLVAKNEEDVANKILTYKINNKYNELKEKYSYKNSENCELEDFILNLQ